MTEVEGYNLGAALLGDPTDSPGELRAEFAQGAASGEDDASDLCVDAARPRKDARLLFQPTGALRVDESRTQDGVGGPALRVRELGLNTGCRFFRASPLLCDQRQEDALFFGRDCHPAREKLLNFVSPPLVRCSSPLGSTGARARLS